MELLPKILIAQQTKAVDNHTIKNHYNSSWELMEKASEAFAKAILAYLKTTDKIAVICGIGNNGGDGLAVARILQDKEYKIQPFLILFKETLSNDCKKNFDRLENVIIIKPNDKLPNFNEFDIIIDAILGSGLTKPVTGFLENVIDNINSAQKTVYSIDIPSGLFCDKLSSSHAIVKSDVTISFQIPKLSFFFPENANYLKNWKVVNIGLDEDFIQQQESNYYVLNNQIDNYLKTRPRQSHKGSYGHALVIAGSYGKVGAAVLATKACLRSGAGLVTANIPKCGYTILQTAVPEAMCLSDENEKIITQLPNISKFTSIGIGPGLDINSQTYLVLKQLFKQSKIPLVIDADAINIISKNDTLKPLIPKNSILTPHIKEFDRLVGTSTNSEECFQKQIEFSKKHQCIVVLKNAFTSISTPNGNLYFNTSGNQGMATGGSGDVLTGIITGLLAQGYTPIQAALIGVFFHGKAGDKAAKEKGYNALIASDAIAYLKIEKNYSSEKD